MSKVYKTWVYHKEEQPIIVDSDEAQKYYDSGWADTPAAFIDVTEMGVDINDPLQVHAVGSFMNLMKDEHNWFANIENQTRNDIRDWAKMTLDMKLKIEKKSLMIDKVMKELEKQNEDE